LSVWWGLRPHQTLHPFLNTDLVRRSLT
jgi:hypothetical protein